MKSQDNVGIQFVNFLIGHGHVYGVVNLSFGAYNFSPSEDGNIDLDPVVVARLRLDENAFMQLRDVVNALYDKIQQEKNNLDLATKMETVEKIERVMPKRGDKTH